MKNYVFAFVLVFGMMFLGFDRGPNTANAQIVVSVPGVAVAVPDCRLPYRYVRPQPTRPYYGYRHPRSLYTTPLPTYGYYAVPPRRGVYYGGPFGATGVWFR